MLYDVIVIGGGAAGMCTAIHAKRNNKSVLIIEHNDKTGKKILSTGNGRCNLTNMNCKADLFDCNPEGISPYFTSGDVFFVKDVIRRFDCDDTLRFFGDLGLVFENKNGYVYPRSGQAKSVLDILRGECIESGVEIVTGYQPLSVSIKDGLFDIDGTDQAEKLVIATGGASAPKTGSDGSGYEIAKAFGHSIINPRPALCGLNCRDKVFKKISGVRNDSLVKLICDGHKVMEVYGNVQFNDYGISGIPVFQISSEAGRLLEEKKQITVDIDLLPDIRDVDLKEAIKKNPSLTGILNEKLAKEILKRGNIIENIRKFTVTPDSIRGFDESQVTAGGVNTAGICPETMESTIVDNLYFAGEIIDVNGICGGYNLQWAWSTGYVAGNNI